MRVVHERGLFYNCFGTPAPVVQYLRQSVPGLYRYFLATPVPHWVVHRDYLANTLRLAAKYDTNIVCEVPEAIPDVDDLQITYTITMSLEAAYQTLHLISTAPSAMIDASWKVLVNIHHPDKGGSITDFLRIKQAYEVLKHARNNGRASSTQEGGDSGT